MRCLVVLAHPLRDSLNAHFARLAVDELSSAGHETDLLDLYADDFDPRLTQAERSAHYRDDGPSPAMAEHAARLAKADALVLVFPTWWFGLPAILKGWFDRVFAPGVAFDHSPDFGPIRPRLATLRHVVAVTTLGSPWWIDMLVLRRPVRRILKTAIFGACAPKARFRYLALHDAERPAPERVARFERRIRKALSGLS